MTGRIPVALFLLSAFPGWSCIVHPVKSDLSGVRIPVLVGPILTIGGTEQDPERGVRIATVCGDAFYKELTTSSNYPMGNYVVYQHQVTKTSGDNVAARLNESIAGRPAAYAWVDELRVMAVAHISLAAVELSSISMTSGIWDPTAKPQGVTP